MRLRSLGEPVVALLLVFPALAVLAIVKFYPLYLGARISMTDATPTGSHSVGTANYRAALRDPLWHQALTNSAKGLLVLPLFVLLPLFLAYLIYHRAPGWQVFRGLFFTGNLLSPAMIGIVFALVLGGSGPWVAFGRATHISFFSEAPIADVHRSMYAVYGVALWATFGLGVLTYLAGMTAIPRTLFDAARIDGAGFIRQFVNVVVPGVFPTIAYWSIVCSAGMLLWLFPIIYSLTSGGPGTPARHLRSTSGASSASSSVSDTHLR